MKILDLDLDCFIEGIAHFRNDKGERSDDQKYPPWSEDGFREFLEKQCGLSKSQPVIGKVVKEHVEVFQFWSELIENDLLKVPFEVTHVDAHSDMAINGSGYTYLTDEFLLLKIEERKALVRNLQFLDSGNFIAYALALRWIDCLNFVHHLEYLDNDDFQGTWFKDNNPHSGFIEMKGYGKLELPFSIPDMHRKPVVIEPQIPFNLLSVSSFNHTSKFNFATLSQSPGFTPKSADLLLDIFKEYIEEVE